MQRKEQIKSKNAHRKLFKKQVLVTDQEAVDKVSSANEKLGVSLAREEAIKAAPKKTIDVLKINSKSKLRENGKRVAQALEKRRRCCRRKSEGKMRRLQSCWKGRRLRMRRGKRN